MSATKTEKKTIRDVKSAEPIKEMPKTTTLPYREEVSPVGEKVSIEELIQKGIDEGVAKTLAKIAADKEEAPIDKILKEEKVKVMEKKVVALKDMPLTCLREYEAYNVAARKESKRLGLVNGRCVYPCIPCPVELHPTQKIIFSRIDQPQNALPVYKSDHLIHFEMTLYPGQVYELPVVIVNYLADLGVPHWETTDLPNGTKEVAVTHIEPRFAFRSLVGA